MKHLVKQLCPPIVWNGLAATRRRLSTSLTPGSSPSHVRLSAPDEQDLDVYWDPEMALALETWGEGTVWHELKYLGAGLGEGRVLDLACGIGKNIEDLRAIGRTEVYGCDISDLLIEKALERGIPPEFLKVCDAKKSGYEDGFFEYSYSIGSLEHFTEADLPEVLGEIRRITKRASFHMIPVSTSGKDEGWIKTKQSYYCNSVGWWEQKFQSCFREVRVLDSIWRGEYTRGVWLVCHH